MLYLLQDFNIHPASPATRDRFIELATKEIVPGWERLGGRLVAAWFNHVEWFSQLNHVIEFDDIASYEAARTRAQRDAAWSDAQSAVEALAPERSERLFEPLGPVPVARLQQAIEDAAARPEGAYTFAILDVNAGRMQDFSKLLESAAPSLPILASWRPLGGNPDQVIDLWAGDMGRQPYRPSNAGMESFFGPLREIAPRERMVSFFPLPYSPLR